MQVAFWGTRGSIPKPGLTTVRHGGNTPCLEVRSNSGASVILDCGTGAHSLGSSLLSRAPVLDEGSILLSHFHWDHIQGLPFFAPLRSAATNWRIYGPRTGGTLYETLALQMRRPYFPVSLDDVPAPLEFCEIGEEHFAIGDIQITTQLLNHPDPCLGYRLEADGVTVVYATDHEPFRAELAIGKAISTSDASDHRHVQFLAGADLVIHDAQYTAAEYATRVGWGHSTVEYAVTCACAAEVRELVLFHHEPQRDDEAIDALLRAAKERLVDGSGLGNISAATEGTTLNL